MKDYGLLNNYTIPKLCHLTMMDFGLLNNRTTPRLCHLTMKDFGLLNNSTTPRRCHLTPKVIWTPGFLMITPRPACGGGTNGDDSEDVGTSFKQLARGAGRPL